MHRDAGGVELTEVGERGPDLRPGGAAHGSAHDQDVGERQAVQHRRVQLAGVAADQPGPSGLRTRVPRRGGEGGRADVGHLPGSRRTRDVDELVADRQHRHAGAGVHEHLVAAGRGQHPDLGRAEDDVATDGDVAGLDVLADPPHERRGRHAARHRQLRGAGVGVADGHDRVGERGQRRPGDHVHGLPRLQAQRMARSGRDLADDGQHDRRLLARPGEVDAAHRVTVDRRLVEPGQRAGGDHLLRAAQAVGLGDRHPHRCGTDGAGQDQGELFVDRPHRRHASRRVARAVACRVTSPAEPDAPCSIATPRRSRSVGAEPIGGSTVRA